MLKWKIVICSRFEEYVMNHMEKELVKEAKIRYVVENVTAGRNGLITVYFRKAFGKIGSATATDKKVRFIVENAPCNYVDISLKMFEEKGISLETVSGGNIKHEYTPLKSRRFYCSIDIEHLYLKYSLYNKLYLNV